ncbi:MAG: glycosyltransferase family 2 protein [Pseudolabrys sp.]|nr:glycosyltransferase family 2 protein [Pseudolabrys sp.]MCW5682822.1 glycosyltransferase family 2 protein [Pseudolabrys sp.]
MKLSLIIPAFNEEACLPQLIERLDQCLLSSLAGHEVEVIVVDDHSRDATPALLADYAATRPWLRYIRLLRNSGSHVAIFAGLSVCRGDAAYIMGADLQDPPEVIPQFIAELSRGHKIVLGEREKRDDPWQKTLPSLAFNYFMSRFVLDNFPVRGGDVFMLDRDIIDAVLQCNEKNVNIFVLMLSLCSDVGTVSYHRRERIAGQSKWNLRKLAKLAFDSVITVGYLPLKAILYLGLGTFCLSVLILIYLVAIHLFGFVTVPGWTSVLALISLFGGLNMVAIAIVGEYLWRNFDQTRQRPIFIIERQSPDRATGSKP